ncbi:MAG: hypothetical protein COT06_11805 [Syntrophobacteraceae bacterium CG07_land_8_20_14_0_80_61_8]|nr:MAG: hypothetical protein COT06_11805 [Syntrophobacteraceae bacterium CG07_land_8_20_14_0_80_61_8]
MALARTTLFQPALLRDGADFDLEAYRLRMASYLAEDAADNRIFFDALDFARELHLGQTRKSGAPYISHPCAVAEILAAELAVKDPRLLAAALLHDVVEDIEHITNADIDRRFGSTVAELVDGCTKLARSSRDRASLKDLTHSKIFLTASRRLGVLVIKLADRLHNLRTLHYLPKSKRQRIAQETAEVYAPLAAKLNIFRLKRELYHQALTNLFPKQSKKILNSMKALVSHPDVLALEAEIRDCFAHAPIQVTCRTRVKGLGNYYNPIQRSLKIGNAENRVDLVLVTAEENPLDCYLTLGVVNSHFTAIARSIRDFIANPKNTGYVSLHTRIHYRGENYLVKIRTPLMDEWALSGLLGEWGREDRITDAHLQEVSEFLRNLGEYGGAGPRRRDLLRLSEAEEIAAYTPKGEVLAFPRGSLVLDFAYQIHSDLGNHCEGALLNGAWAPCTQVLSDGDTVEIIMSDKAQDLDPDLEFQCKTPKARTAINKTLQRRRLHHARAIGRQVLVQEMRRHGLDLALLDGDLSQLVLEVYNLKEIQDLYARIGQDLVSPKMLLYDLQGCGSTAEATKGNAPPETTAQEHNILALNELDWAVHKFAQCCKPYPGQSDVVAILSERGVTFHQSHCHDLHKRHDLPEQSLLEVSWRDETPWDPPLQFQIQATSESSADLLDILAHLPGDIDLEWAEITTTPRHRKSLKLAVNLTGFAEARAVFSRFPNAAVSIERYCRMICGSACRLGLPR